MTDESDNDGEFFQAIDYVRSWRVVLGLSLAKLSKMSGIDSASISRYERGVFAIDLVTLNKIASSLNMPYQSLLIPPPRDLKRLLEYIPDEVRPLFLRALGEMIIPIRDETTHESD